MAIPISPNMYSGGAVELDSTPVTNMYAQLMARKQAQEQAKNEAFDEYIRGLNTKITPAGVRTADLDAFNDKKNKWVEFGMKNKDKLMKNDVATQTEFNRLYQETINIPIESKAAEEQKKPFVEILTDPNKRNRLSSNVFPAVQSHDEPLYIKDPKTGEYVRNYNRKPIDYNSNLFDPQFDFTKGFESWSKGMDKPETIGDVLRKDPVTGRAIVATTKAYTPDAVKQIGLNAARSVADNPEYGNYYQHKFEKLGEEEYKKLNEAFQEVYGKQTELTLPNGQKTKINNYIDSPEEVAAAEAIIQAKSLTEKGEKAALDYEQRQADKRLNISLNVRSNSGGTTTTDANEFDRIPAGLSLPNANGVIYNKDESAPYTGDWAITGANIPLQTRAILKTGGIELSQYKQYLLDIKNGEIRAIKSQDGKTLIADRTDMLNAQKKWNSEPQKGQQPQFGNRGNNSQNPVVNTPPQPKTNVVEIPKGAVIGKQN